MQAARMGRRAVAQQRTRNRAANQGAAVRGARLRQGANFFRAGALAAETTILQS
jgi:hypothetical protein